jgi:peptidoglycan hydrolase-like protein with peptidoglycan-binding domain
MTRNYYNGNVLNKDSQDKEEIKKWQTFLNTKEYTDSDGNALTVDGILGDKTAFATSSFQERNGLAKTGIVDAETWEKAGFWDITKQIALPDKPVYETYKPVPEFKNESFDATTEGEELIEARKAADKALQAHRGQTIDRAALDDIMARIQGREKFSYDLNGDALYQQYKDKYIGQGKMAMQDAMGQASAMTGGYGNSYAAAVGNQAYQASLQNLNDIVPELYQMAYDRYNQEGQDMYNQYTMLLDDYNTRYGQYLDKDAMLQGDLTRADNEYYKRGEIFRGEQDTSNSLLQKDWENNNTVIDNKNSLAQQDWENSVFNTQWEEQDRLNELNKLNAGAGVNLSVEEWNRIISNCELHSANPSMLEAYINGLVDMGYISEEAGAKLFESYKGTEE